MQISPSFLFSLLFHFISLPLLSRPCSFLPPFLSPSHCSSPSIYTVIIYIFSLLPLFYFFTSFLSHSCSPSSLFPASPILTFTCYSCLSSFIPLLSQFPLIPFSLNSHSILPLSFPLWSSLFPSSVTLHFTPFHPLSCFCFHFTRFSFSLPFPPPYWSPSYPFRSLFLLHSSFLTFSFVLSFSFIFFFHFISSSVVVPLPSSSPSQPASLPLASVRCN